MSMYGFTDNYCFSLWISFQPLLDIAIYIQKLTGAIGIQVSLIFITAFQ